MSANDKGLVRRLFTAVLLLAALLLPTAPAQAAVTANVYIDWGQTQRTITNELYGIGLFGGVSPSIATQPTYKTNLSYFKPGLVRFHYAGLTNSSATDTSGWVDEANRTWDSVRIAQVMGAIDSLNSSQYGFYRPAKLVNIPDFPSWMRRVSYNVGGETIELLDPSEYDNYAAFCAQLVTILKNQGRNVKYYTPTNERDDIYYVKWRNASQPDKLDELITIYNKAAVAMKAADPSIKVGGLEFARGDLTDQVRRFVRGAKPNIDFVAYHFYANGDTSASNDSVYNRTQDAQRHGLDIVNIVNQEGLNVPVFNTEFNINYNAQQEYRQGLSEGAVYDALVFTGAIDNGEPATMGWNDRDGYYGKLNNDSGNSIRMGAHNLQMFNNYMVGDRVTSTSDNGSIVTMAVKTGSRKSIALINRSGSSQTVKLNFTPAWSTTSSFNRYVAAPAPDYYYSTTTSYADATNGNLTVQPNSVTVLTVADSQNVASNSVELSRSGWTASASNSEGSLPPGNVLDNNNATRWGTGTQQASGQWFQVDLGSSQTFDRIVLDAGNSTDDFLRRYEVYATNDLNNLGTPLVTGAGIATNGSSYGTGGGTRDTPTTIYLAPQTKRYIRVVSKGSDSYYWWVIHELRVFNHGGGGGGGGGGGTGTGLKGDYYNAINLTGAVALSRTDSQVNFDWGNGSPGAGVNSDNFSARWTGEVEAPVSGGYTFATTSDDGVRLSVNGSQIINNWTDHGPTTNTSSSVNLTAGQKVSITMEYYERGGGATAKLLWAYPGQVQQPIPQSRLYPATGTGGGGGGGTTTYLSDLTWASATSGWQTVQKDKNINGGNLVLNGVTYSKGLGVHANSEIVYNLNSQYNTFLAEVGSDDGIGNSTHTSLVFQVWLDNVKVYDSGTMYYDTATKSISLSVAGKNQLKLVVTDAASWDGNWDDWADWAMARVQN